MGAMTFTTAMRDIAAEGMVDETGGIDASSNKVRREAVLGNVDSRTNG